MKIFCDYCHGMTFDDSRGNCAACGGPRPKIEQISPAYHYAFQVEHSSGSGPTMPKYLSAASNIAFVPQGWSLIKVSWNA